MKKLFLIILAAISVAGYSQAQTATNQPILLPPIGLTNGLSPNHGIAAAQELWYGIEDLAPFTTNGLATVQIGYGRNFSDHHQIEALAVDVPMNTNQSLTVSATIIGEHYGNQWSEGGGTLTFSHSGDAPVI